ncbi:PadR family transcriptional regulator [Ekhidna sp.]|uniref:PadR family transcriptional regulator n=1 Tax=Ekhidna sp. TaxID=2608089 RepID=UPI003CCBE59E
MYSNELIRGTLKTIILQLLSENDKMYGYELSKVVKERTKDKIVLTEGALYPILHKLEKDKLVTVTFDTVGNRTRKYYALTESGKNSSKVKRNELFDFMETLSAFMNPKTSVQCMH